MTDSPVDANLIDLTADIVSAYVSNNTVPSGDIPALINQVHAALTRVSGAPGEAPAHGSTGDAAFCTLWSYTGLPSITLPLLSGPAGLPLGVQVVGAAGDDGRLLRTANWIVKTLSDTGGPE